MKLAKNAEPNFLKVASIVAPVPLVGIQKLKLLIIIIIKRGLKMDKILNILFIIAFFLMFGEPVIMPIISIILMLIIKYLDKNNKIFIK